MQNSGTVRPIRFRFQNSVTAYQILNKAKKLKDIDANKSVYLSPGRSPDKKDSRSKLVEELNLKRKRLSDRVIRILCIIFEEARLCV